MRAILGIQSCCSPRLLKLRIKMMLILEIVLIAVIGCLVYLVAGGIRTAWRVRTLRRALDRNNPDPVAREKVFKDVARRAGERVPDEVHLSPVTMVMWKDEDKWRESFNALEEHGFRHAGNYRVNELGVDVQFLINEDQCALACIYNHPAVGVFMDVVTRFTDGSSVTFANRQGTGLDQHPEFQNKFLGDISASELVERALRERPDKPRRCVHEEDLVPDFCRVWKEYKQWRKKRGTSAEEVERIYERLQEKEQ